MSIEGLKRYWFPTLAVVLALSTVVIAALVGDVGMKILALVLFNAPILVICVSLPFVGSLRSALQEKGPAGAIESTSYSRITGLFGAVAVTAFFWAVGNAVLWRVFDDASEAKDIVQGVWEFFILGAALFLPYAFNQLRSILTDRQQHTVEMERLKLAPGVTVPGTPGTTVLINKP